jgi:hypothetical protein
MHYAKCINMMMSTILFVFTVCFGGPALASDERLYIDEGKVGEIAIGMDVSSLIKKYPARFKKTVVQRESEESPAFIYTFNNGKPITIEVHETRGKIVVWFITVEDPNFKTREGIAVGNTFKEVKKAYPNAVFYATEAEGESIGLNEKGFWFGFDISGVNREWWLQEKKDINAIQNIKVIGINIVH